MPRRGRDLLARWALALGLFRRTLPLEWKGKPLQPRQQSAPCSQLPRSGRWSIILGALFVGHTQGNRSSSAGLAASTAKDVA